MFSLKDKVIICLHNLGYSSTKMWKLYEIFGDFDNILTDIENKKEEVIKWMGEVVYNNLKNSVTKERVEQLSNNLINKNIGVFTFFNPEYPAFLRHIQNPPILMYYKGDINLLNYKYTLGIVGTRKPSSYGREMTEKFTADMVNNGVVTVSGLAYGVDSIVATKTLELGGRTIAVLANGIDQIYPASNVTLAKKILNQGGLIMTEFKPGEEPTQFNFPERNRIISAISSGVLIPEAGENSGSIITANCTVEFGKPLYILPVNLTSVPSKGNLALLREYPDCVCVCSEDILRGIGALRFSEEMNMSAKNLINSNLQLTIEQQLVYDVLAEDETSFDDLVIKSKIGPSELIGLLTEMEMLNIIKRVSGNIYSLK